MTHRLSRLSRAPVGGLVVVGFALSLGLAPRSAAAELRSVEGAARLFDLWAEQQIEYRGIPGLALAVVHDGRVVWTRAYGASDLVSSRAMTPSTPFRVGSVSKLVTSTAVVAARDEGSLRLDEPVATYIPAFPASEDGRSATVRDLLLHTSGLPREAPFPYWTDHVFPDRDELLDALATTELRSAPGEEYRYSNFGMGLLGEVVAAATGIAFDRYVRDRLFEPLGMASSTVAPTDLEIEELAVGYFRRRPDGSRGRYDYYDTGALAGAANVVSTVEDLARFAAFHLGAALPGGEGGALERPTAASLREMHRPHFLRPGWTSARGLGFSVAPLGSADAVSHGGWIAGHRTHFLLVPDERTAVVTFVNSDDGEPYTFAQAAYETFAPVLAGDRSASESERAAPAAWEGFAGLYADPWEWEYRVLTVDGHLVLYGYSYPPAERPIDGVTWLEPSAPPGASDPTAFRMPDGDPVRFELGPEGGVVRLQRRDNFLSPVAPAGGEAP